MDAVTLLLNAGDTVEAVHQAAWYVLLQKSELLAELGLETPANRKVDWEPENGLFDLRVAGEGQSVCIELKVDSDLSEAQAARQLSRAESGRVLYVLLGSAAIRARPWTTKFALDRGAQVVTSIEVSAALDRAAAREGTVLGVAQLARAYAAQLRDLSVRGADFDRVETWNSLHVLALYDKLRKLCDPMRESVVTYVPTPSGGFEACHWGWIAASEGVRCYLQWEGSGPTPPKLCFKIEVTGSADRDTSRAAAVEFLRNRPLSSTTIARPARLGSGQTMTVGVIEDLLTVLDKTQWQHVIEGVLEATRVMHELAEHLRNL